MEAGRLVIKPKSKAEVPSDWLQSNHDGIVSDIADLTGVCAFRYTSFNTGKYDRHKAAGINLRFDNLINGTDAYVIFNVDLTRQRTTKQGMKGEPLPGKRFTVGGKSKFHTFWNNSGLKEPDKRTKYSSYMGKLKSIIFTGVYDKGDLKRTRLDKDSLLSLAVSHHELLSLIKNKPCTTDEQGVNNTCTTSMNKEIGASQQPRGLQPDSATGENKYGNKVIRKEVIGKPKNVSDTPLDQTVDEWLMDYEEADDNP